MEKRLVKKEEIEKQLQEIVALIEQVDAKMVKSDRRCHRRALCAKSSAARAP